MKQKGQGIVEFAIMVPFLIAVGVAVIYVGGMMVNYTQYSNAVRMAARDIAMQTMSVQSTKDEGTAYRAAAAERKYIVDQINKNGKTAESKAILDRYESEVNGFGNFYDPTWKAQFYYEDTGSSDLKKTDDPYLKGNTGAVFVVEVSVNLKLKNDVTIGHYLSDWGIMRSGLNVTYRMVMEKPNITFVGDSEV